MPLKNKTFHTRPDSDGRTQRNGYKTGPFYCRVSQLHYDSLSLFVVLNFITLCHCKL